MHRYAISDRQWRLIEPFLPVQDGAGHPWREHRPLIDAILWILHTGSPWRDLPADFGPWETAYYRFNRWRQEGLWDVIARRLQLRLRRERRLDFRQGSIDGSSIRASKAAAGALKKGARRRSRRTTRWENLGVAGARRSISSPKVPESPLLGE
jgi:transposase